MIKIIKSPQPLELDHRMVVFLAGTIDNGDSVDWQSEVAKSLADLDVILLNPRRDEWDSSWEQSIKNPIFKEQVEWELDGLDKADLIFLYFAANSKSPISLLELGLYASSKKMIIVCPAGFWRLGNVEVIANRFQIPIFDNLEDGFDALKKKLLENNTELLD